jgi:nucleoside 2-deoxyribosyltransferase
LSGFRAPRHDADVLNVYVAGASAEVDRAERVIAALRAAGINITHDWTPDVRAVEAAGGPTTLEDQERLDRALVDVAAVRRADFVVMLAPEPPHASTGAGFESGVAYERGLPLVVAGSVAARRRFLFGALVVEYESDVEVVAWLTDPERTAA